MTGRLTATGVSVAFGGTTILDEVDLSVGAGELLALVGPNGAGKSTLLGVLAGDVAPDAGEVTLDGRPIGDWRVQDLARERSVLLQKQALAFGFRVEDVVRMGRSPWYRTPRAEDDDHAVADAMLRADVAALAERSFPTLSGGEQARASFARILAQDTAVLLLDEPTAALDLRHQESLLATCRALARTGRSVVVVLHDLSLAGAYADRVALLADGRVRAEGPPRDVLTAELLTEVYQHPVQVLLHQGCPVVVPVRGAVSQRPAHLEEASCQPVL